MEIYDLVIIGGGEAGLRAAEIASKFGVKIALIEKQNHETTAGLVGEKSLTLHKVAKTIYESRKLKSTGLKVPKNIIWNGVKEQLSTADIKTSELVRRLSKQIDFLYGEAKFVSTNVISIDKRREIKGRKIIIATGAHQTIPKIRGLSKITYFDTNSIFSIPKLPSKLAIIGGGVDGCELASTFSMLGVTVFLIEKQSNLLPDLDISVRKIVRKRLEEIGANVLLGSNVERVVRYPRSIELRIKTKSGKENCRINDIVFASGKDGNFSLDLSRGHVAFTKEGISTNSCFQTTNQNVYAIGDVTNWRKSAIFAYESALVAVHHALTGTRRKDIIPLSRTDFVRVDPGFVAFGEGESELKKRKAKYKILQSNSNLANSDLEAKDEERITLYVNRRRILGGILAGSGAIEASGILTYAYQNKIPFIKLTKAPFGRSSLGSNIKDIFINSYKTNTHKSDWIKKGFNSLKSKTSQIFS